jgi:hypothetical protein
LARLTDKRILKSDKGVPSFSTRISEPRRGRMIGKVVEKKECQQFEIPGAKARYKNSGFPFLINGFSEFYPLLNVGKGGLAFECQKRLAPGKKIKVQLSVPGFDPISLRGWVGWRRHDPRELTDVIIVHFMPFGAWGGNSAEDLEMLRHLEDQFGKREEEGEFNPVRDHLF